MAGKLLEVSVNPAIIRWARESAGWNIEEIAKKLKTSIENYEKIETGRKSPTYNQLKILAIYFNRPLSVFFLPDPPQELLFTASFRILPKNAKDISKELRLVIRKARYYQSIANELMNDLRTDIKPKTLSVFINEDPIKIAQKERERVGIPIDKQLKWQSAYEAFNEWRSAIEKFNILILQYKFPLLHARGFSLMDKKPPVIVLNSSDNILARIFTLFHEYAHVCLRLPEIYAGEEEISANNLEVENWCNCFASEFLVPESVLKNDTGFQEFMRSRQLSQDILENLSKKFRVSKHALLTKLRFLNLITQEYYESELVSLKDQPFVEKKGFLTPPYRCIQEKGKQFVSLVLQSKEKGSITTADMFEYLSVKLKHLHRIEELITK